MRKVVLTAVPAGLAVAVLVGAQSLSAGHGKSRIKADTFSGCQEVAGPTAGLASKGTGEFNAEIDDDNQTVAWKLTYTGLASPATVAHIHFGNLYLSAASPRSSAGARRPRVIAAGPSGPAPTSRTSRARGTPADIAGPGAQGIAPANGTSSSPRSAPE